MVKNHQIISLICLTLAACSPGGSSFVKSHKSRAALANHDHLIFDYSGITTVAGSGTWKNIFFLNFEGATVAAGESFIISGSGLSRVTIPPFDPASVGAKPTQRAAVIDEIMARVAGTFAGFEISFTTDDPGRGSVIHIGGRDFRNQAPSLGVAPYDPNNFNGNDIGFIFAEEFLDYYDRDLTKVLANVIAHEIAHSLGADHIDNPTGLMNPQVGADNTALTSGASGQDPNRIENTAEVLRLNIGLVANRDTRELPDIVALAKSAQGDVRQYSIYSLENKSRNPTLNLGLYRYTWRIGATTAVGTGVRIPDPSITEVTLVVANATTEREFQFKLP